MNACNKHRLGYRNDLSHQQGLEGIRLAVQISAQGGKWWFWNALSTLIWQMLTGHLYRGNEASKKQASSLYAQ